MKQVTIVKETDIIRESPEYKGIRRFNSPELPTSAGLPLWGNAVLLHFV